MKKNYKVLFYIGNLSSGGKERRLIELMTYLKLNTNVEFQLVLTEPKIHFDAMDKLQVPVIALRSQPRNCDLTLFSKFYKVCKAFKPDIVHTWGAMQTFYTLPSIIGLKIPLVNSQITSAPPSFSWRSPETYINRINFAISKLILSNSYAGIKAYNPPRHKTRVIYNGLNPDRFRNLPPIAQVKEEYHIRTAHMVIMSASFSPNKDHELFFQLAKKITAKRKNITFVGIGGHAKASEIYQDLVRRAKNEPRILYPGSIQEVEALVQASDLGVMFSNKKVHGEGISNSILEYMALAKPVIANDAGGTSELVLHQKNGYLITHESMDEIAEMIIELIDNKEKNRAFGEEGKRIISEKFNIELMGETFEKTYLDILSAGKGPATPNAHNSLMAFRK